MSFLPSTSWVVLLSVVASGGLLLATVATLIARVATRDPNSKPPGASLLPHSASASDTLEYQGLTSAWTASVQAGMSLLTAWLALHGLLLAGIAAALDKLASTPPSAESLSIVATFCSLGLYLALQLHYAWVRQRWQTAYITKALALLETQLNLPTKAFTGISFARVPVCTAGNHVMFADVQPRFKAVPVCLAIAYGLLLTYCVSTIWDVPSDGSSNGNHTAELAPSQVIIVTESAAAAPLVVSFPIFARGSFTTSAANRPVAAERLAEALVDCSNSEGPILELRGYADASCFDDRCDSASDLANVELANRRARSLADFLEHPAQNKTEPAKAVNRIRLEVPQWEVSPTGYASMRRGAAFVDHINGLYKDGAGQLNRRVDVLLRNAGSCSYSTISSGVASIRR